MTFVADLAQCLAVIGRDGEEAEAMLRDGSEIQHLIALRHFGPVVREVRGRGLLIGIEFAIPGPAGDLLIELISHGVVANHSLNSHLVLRLTPPAVLSVGRDEPPSLRNSGIGHGPTTKGLRPVRRNPFVTCSTGVLSPWSPGGRCRTGPGRWRRRSRRRSRSG